MKVLGLATVQDLGRVGHAAEGVPRGGALSRRLLRAANAAVGNDERAAAIEVFGRLVIGAKSDTSVATDRGDVRLLHAGDEYRLDPEGGARVRYLAVRGGVDAPVVLGSQSTLLGCFGAPLRPGDDLPSAGMFGSHSVSPNTGAARELRVVAGPDEPEAFSKLLGTWRIDHQSDRRGTRLVGRHIDVVRRDVLPSSPMTIGAIQLPAGGEPIVVGPDGPTTGGYPILGVLSRACLDAFHEAPLGAEIALAAGVWSRAP